MLVVAASLALIALGAGALAAPVALARGYGIEADGATALAYVRAAGVRDLLFGLTLDGLVYLHAEAALVLAVVLCILVALGDLTIVFTARRAAAPMSLATHAGGAAGFAVIWFLLANRL